MRSTGTLRALHSFRDSPIMDRMISCWPQVETSDVGRRVMVHHRMFITPALTTTNMTYTSGNVHRATSWPSASGSPSGQRMKLSSNYMAAGDVISVRRTQQLIK